MSDQLKPQANPVSTVPSVQTAGNAESTEITIDLVELFYRLLGSWKLILCSALILAVLTGVYTLYFITPMYRATATIYVLTRDSALNLSDLNFGNALTQDYIKVFNMWEVHEKVIQNLGLNYTYSGMRKNLSVTNPSSTRMLEISFTSPSPEEARSVANEYAIVGSDYIEETMATDKPHIVSVALLPTSPVSPNKTRNIMLGFILGALIAAGIVTLRYIMDDKYKTAEDIRRYTGLNNLAAIPDEEDVDEDERKKKGRREL